MNQSEIRGDATVKPFAIEVKAMSLAVEGRTILEDVSFQLDAGEFLCICGPNGAGKTMLLKAILGLAKPTLGSVSILGLSSRDGRRKTGYVPQRKNFDRMFPARVVEVIAAHLSGAWPLVVSAEARDKAAAALRIVGGEHLLDKELRDLSGGELQRAFLARALAAEPELLILDEPMAGVDAQGISDITNLLDGIARQRRLTIVMITHSLEVVEHCATKLIFMESGRIRAFGNPSELLRDPSFHESAFTGHDHEHAVTSGKGEY